MTSLIRWIIGSSINIHHDKTERCFTWHFLFFQLITLIIFMGWFLYYYHFLRKGVKKRIKFFVVHVISTLTICFCKSLLHKSSYTLSWIYYNLYQVYYIFIRHNLACPGTMDMEIDLFKTTKCFAHYICSYIICISSNSLKAPCARILKCKIKNLIYSLKIWQIHKYNRKTDYNLKFIFCTRLERYLLFRFELSSLVTLSKHWL